MRPKRRIPLHVRFFKFIGKDFIPKPLTEDFDPGTQCWPWYGALSSQGYGLIWKADPDRPDAGKHVYAHVLSFEYFRGPVPDNKILEITCENKSCSNPRHLKPITRSQHATTRLRVNRKTAQFGETNGRSKVTEEDVRYVRELHTEKRYAEITEFGVSKGMTKEGIQSIARARGRARRGRKSLRNPDALLV